MAKEVVVTQQGLTALEDELEHLKIVRRKEVAEKIKVARGYGDLSENAEYDAAKKKSEEMMKANKNKLREAANKKMNEALNKALGE